MAHDDLTSRWLKRIGTARHDAGPWIGRGQDIVRIYRNEKADATTRDKTANTVTNKIRTEAYNSLYVTTEIIRPALFAKAPIPDVRRRFTDENQIATEAASIMEDALAFYVDDNYKFDMDAAVKDYLLAGRGHMRVRFLPVFEKRKFETDVRTSHATDGDSHVHIITKGQSKTSVAINAGNNHRHDMRGFHIMPHPDGHTHHNIGMERVIEAMQTQQQLPRDLEIDDDGGLFVRNVVFEEIEFEHVEWKEVIIPKVRRWRDVSWIAFIHNMTKVDVEDRFGAEVVSQLQFDDVDDDTDTTVEIFEVWDKDEREVIHVSEQSDRPLEGPSPDPLDLEGFFPIPKPLTANPTSGTLTPVPDYAQYQELAGQLDDQTRQIGVLSKALKASGLYNGRFSQLGEIAESAGNTMIAVDNMGEANDSGGLSNHVWMWPLKEVNEAISQLYAASAETKQAIADLSGVSDILRGVTNPNEAMGTNRIKGQFATLRLRARQEEIMRYNRDLLRIGAELIANNFQASTLSRVTGKQVSSEVMTVLRDDAIRDFNIDVETDSTIAVDEVAEQEAVTNMMTGLVAMVQGFGPAVESGQIPGEAVAALMKIALRPFKGARELDAVLSSLSEPDAQAQAMQQQMEQKDQQIEALQSQMQELLKDRQLEEAALAIARGQADAKALNDDGKLALDSEKEDNRVDIENRKIDQKRESEHADRLVKLEIEDEKLSLDADKTVFQAGEARSIQ